jgi:uncharacterized protein (DUF1330 family)
MPAYLLIDGSTTDPDAMAAYGPLATASVKQHDGRPLASGTPTVLQSGWNPERIVLMRFGRRPGT